ncbi:MAG: hypothetical protein ACLP0J_16715 [Solirubrobacteraceae bacterium]
MTYTYKASATTDMVNGARAEATATIAGKSAVVATGAIRGQKLVLRFKHLGRGRYRLTLFQLRAHEKPQMIGHTSLVIS